jgi:hypothetical protein
MLDRESACNRVFLVRRFVLFGADGVGLRFEPCSFVFQAGRCPQIDNVVTAALLPHQPDGLRRRRDRYDNGERATPLDVPATQWNQAKFFNDFSRACARVRARRGGFGVCILLDNHVGRFVADAEAIYSYEGTREINTLIVGKAITGLSAFV